MKTHGADTAVYGIKFAESIGRADLLSFPLLYRLMKSAMPELLDGSPRSKILQNRILAYIFDEKSTESVWLRNQLPEPLYTSLYGLKAVLRKTGNINVLTLAVEEHKRRFACIFDED